MRDINYVTLLANQPLAIGGAPNTFGKDFPMGRGWLKTRIRIRIALVIGTGVTTINESGLLFIKNIFMKTDANEILCNLSGRALYKFLHVEHGTLPFGVVTVPAATGDTDIYLDIPHILGENFFSRNDTILDTGRYKSITLQVTLGTVADLLVTPGTATVSAVIDAEAITTAGVLPKKAQPLFYRSLFSLAPVVPTVQTYLEMDRARDLAIMKVMVASTATATAGVAFTGVGSDIVINDFDFKDQDKFYFQSRLWGFNQSDDKNEYGIEAVQAGFSFLEFAKDGSVFSSLYTGNKTQLRLAWRNGTAVGTDQVSAAYDSVRQLVV
jgi:hypothetical protein